LSVNFLPGKPKKDGPTASAGERIPIVALDQTLTVNDALKGLDFYIPTAQARTDWPLPGGTPEQSVEHVEAAPAFAVAWKKGFGKGSSRKGLVISPPVIADGKIFLMDAQATVTALDARTGSQLWHKDLTPKSRRDKQGFGGGVAFANGRLIVTSGFRFVASLDPSNGAVQWQTTVSTPIHSAPTVASGRVFVITTDNEILTFDVNSGAVSWDYQAIVEPARILAASSPAVSSDTVVAAFASGELVAFRSSNGNELWNEVLSRTTRNNALSEIRDVAGRPVIYRGDVYAVDLRTGQSRWSLPVAGITTPWPTGDVVYVTSTAGEVICVARETGQVYWIRDLNEGLKKKKRAYWSGPVLASDQLIVTSSLGEAVKLDPKTGVVKGRLKLGGGSILSPIAANGLVYVATREAQLVAIR